MKGLKNRDKKIVMVKLIMQKTTTTTKTTRYRDNKKLFLVKVLELFLRFQSFYLHTSLSSDVVSPGDWFVSNIWFLLSTELVAIGK
jgi:hypothetical protein